MLWKMRCFALQSMGRTNHKISHTTWNVQMHLKSTVSHHALRLIGPLLRNALQLQCKGTFFRGGSKKIKGSFYGCGCHTPKAPPKLSCEVEEGLYRVLDMHVLSNSLTI